MANFHFSKNIKIPPPLQKKLFFFLLIQKNVQVYVPSPKVHKNCSCKTLLSSFLVQLFEKACCLCMPPHFTIMQWGIPHNVGWQLQDGMQYYILCNMHQSSHFVTTQRSGPNLTVKTNKVLWRVVAYCMATMRETKFPTDSICSVPGNIIL